ncbi:hypothetical protein [Shewanella glacialipiscicola]|uniref:hypothetical protein n=1 Tax=Shewanella glacialipiscicola TaxID=614069 RepID=UPI003D7B8B76
MAIHSAKMMASILCLLGINGLSYGAFANESLEHIDSSSHSLLPSEKIESLAVTLDLGWDSKYISQGRNNLQDGGIYWLNTSVQYGYWTTYALVGRGDSQAYTEWNLGLEYGFNLVENFDANLGYQRIEGYGSSRCQDNELFAELAYTATPWLIPSINYVYSTEANGYFVEMSLHSFWNITDHFSLTPYITQGFDFKYRTAEHNGKNNLQFGLESNYQLSPNMSVSGHISHSIAQGDIEQEATANGDTSSQDQTYAGIHFTMTL